MSANDIEDEAETAAGRPRWLLLALLLAAAGAGFLLLRDLDVFALLEHHGRAILAWTERHPVATVALYLLAFVGLVALSIPGAFAMTVAGGFLFGTIAGAALATVAATLGALAVFLAVRAGFGEAVRRWLLARGSGRFFARVERGLRDDAVRYLLLLRLVPAVPFPVANIAPAFLGVPARLFALTTFFGIMPGTALTAWIGSGLNAVLHGGERLSAAPLRDPALVGPLVALILVLGLPLVLKPMRRR